MHYYEVLGFLLMVGIGLLDPIILVGYVLAGALFKQLYAALTAGFAWVIAAQLFVHLIHIGPAPQAGFAAELMASRIVGSIIAVLVVWLIARQIRRQRAATNDTAKEDD